MLQQHDVAASRRDSTISRRPLPLPSPNSRPVPDADAGRPAGAAGLSHLHAAAPVRYLTAAGSTYIPVDSWVYPAALRLFSKGYIDSAFLDLRPWTRLSLAHILERSADKINDSDDDEAREIFQALQDEVNPDIEAISNSKHGHGEIESLYTRPLGIAGTPSARQLPCRTHHHQRLRPAL